MARADMVSASMNVLIAGCGYVGASLGQRVGARHHVVGWRRRPSGSEGFPVEARDLARSSLGDLAEFDAVVFCATPDARDAAGYRATYVESQRRLLDALARGPRASDARYVFVSSTAVYGDRAGGWVDESSATTPDGFRGEVLLEAEELARTAPAGAVVRLTGIYGPGRARWIDRACDRRARPRAGHWTNRIQRDDGAAVIELVLEDPALDLVIGVDDAPTTELEIANGVARLLGVDPLEPDPEGGAPSGRRCRSQRLARAGFRPRYPTWLEGHRAILAAARERDST